MRKIRTIALSSAAIIAMSGVASAAILTIDGGTEITIPLNYTAPPVVGGTIFSFGAAADDGSIGGGLKVSGPVRVTYTFLGKEAGATNSAFEVAGGLSLSNNGAIGTSIASTNDGGFVDFFYQTIGLSTSPAKIYNGGTSDLSELKIGFQLIDSDSAYAFFGDGRGDADYDDMTLRIDVAPVPLPAGLLLMGTALAGLGAIRRKS
jgi:hypothetical protein